MTNYRAVPRSAHVGALPRAIKEINQLRTLEVLRYNPGLSRSELTERTGLGKATVSAVIGDFVERGLVREIESQDGRPSVGRPPIRLEFSDLRRVAIGVELSGTECIAVLTDLHARPLRAVSYPMEKVTIPATLETLSHAIDEVATGYPDEAVVGTTVGIPGVVEPSAQRIVLAENIDWSDVPLGALATEATSREVTIVNRVNAGALGEYWSGNGRGARSFVYTSLKLGIGAAILEAGQLHDGVNGSAGEIGHISVDPRGPRCRCGNRGCLETFASVPAILGRYKPLVGKRARQADSAPHLTVEDFCALAHARDPRAIAVLREAGGYFGLAVAALVNIVNPDVIVVDSPLLEAGPLFLKSVVNSVSKHAFSVSRSAVRILPASLRMASPVGAAIVAINSAFTSGRILT